MIESLDSVHSFDIFCICETYLTTQVSDKDLEIDGFSQVPFRADNKAIDRPQGGVGVYYKENLPIKNRADLELLDETIVGEVALRNKKVFIVISYRSPSKNSVNELNDYCNKFTSMIENIRKEKPSTIVLTGDFNARSPLFWDQELLENLPGKKLSDFMTLNCLHQLINEPTHFPRDQISTCIDLILTDQPHTFVDSGVIPSPDQNVNTI